MDSETEISDWDKLYQHLIEKLGNKKNAYISCMKKWVSKKMNKKELDSELKEILTPELLRLHNTFILQLYQIQGANYEPDVEEHLDDRFFTNGARVRMSFLISTWERNMCTMELSACDMLITSANNFMKNVLTAIIRKRKSFKIKDGCFSHAIGFPYSPSWSSNPLPTNSKMGIRDAIDAITVYPEVIPRQSLCLMFMEKLLLAQKEESWDDEECEKMLKESDENFKLL